jgi:4-hydroxymandelate oxidase
MTAGDPWQAEPRTGWVPERPPINLHEYEEAARAILPPAIVGFVAGGAEDEASLRGNREAFDRWRLLPRILRGISEADPATTLFGQPIALPVLVAPMGGHQTVHSEGERAAARGAREAGTILCLSTATSVRMEEVAPVAGPWWFQLYVAHDRERCAELIRQAEVLGASAIVVTVDVQKLGRREADTRNGFELPPGVTFPHLLPPGADEQSSDTPGFYKLIEWDAAVGWDDLDWLVGVTTLPLVVKGVLHPDDAREAVERGVRGVIVSNHGGRQLDHAVAALDALPAVAGAVGDRVEVLLDGGIRRGTDVLKALALGARAVMLGRPVLWGLAVDGAAGVARVLDLLRAEIALDLLLCGKASVAEVDRSLVVPVGPLG